jgi:DNA-binding winged helix-turn-helix (wHTH) protein/TolB-like protein
VSAERKSLYRFDDYCLDAVKRVLLRAGEPVPLTPKSVAILLELVERRGEVVTKAELIRSVWPDVFVSDGNLTQNVFALRKSLGESANEARYVATVAGQGYSFIAPVEEIPRLDSSSGIFPVLRPPPQAAAPGAAHPPESVSRASPKRWRRLAVGVAIVAAVLAAAGLVRWQRRPAAPSPAHRPCVVVLDFRNLSQRPGDAWLGSALAEMLITELAADTRLRVVNGDARGAASDSEADRVVAGSYAVSPGSGGSAAEIRLDLRLVRAADGETLSSVTATGTEAELFELVARLGDELRRALDLGRPERPAISPRPSP